MSDPLYRSTDVYPSPPIGMPLEKPKGHIANWWNDCKKTFRGAANYVMSFIGLFLFFGTLGVFAWNHFVGDPELAKAKSENLSFSTFSEELKRVDPQEHKNIETLNVICSDKFIHSNPDGDMLDVCMSEHYKRKARVKVASAEGG